MTCKAWGSSFEGPRYFIAQRANGAFPELLIGADDHDDAVRYAVEQMGANPKDIVVTEIAPIGPAALVPMPTYEELLAENARLRGQAHEIGGVLADVRIGGLKAFDALCVRTLERVAAALSAKA